MIYELILCIGVSAWGCGAHTATPFRTEEACYRALASMRIENGGAQRESDKRRDVVAYCRESKP